MIKTQKITYTPTLRKARIGSKLNLPIPLTATLTSTGTGAGVSTLRLWVTKDITLTLNNTARFYDDAGGTTNEGTTRTVTAGAMRTFYLKCPSGTASLIFSDARQIVRWGDNGIDGWTSSTNAASISGNIEILTNLTYLRVTSSNTLSGSVAGLTNLQYISVFGSNTLSGSVAGLTNLQYISVFGSNTLSGSVAGLTNITEITCFGLNILSGSIAGLPLVKLLNVHGFNTLSGSVAGLTNLEYIDVRGNNAIEFSNVTNLKKLCYIFVNTNITLSSENVNQILADFWLNKDEAKPRANRTIDLRGSINSGSPTGQGITDASNLANYRSPNNIVTNALWTVLTR